MKEVYDLNSFLGSESFFKKKFPHKMLLKLCIKINIETQSRHIM